MLSFVYSIRFFLLRYDTTNVDNKAQILIEGENNIVIDVALLMHIFTILRKRFLIQTR